MTKRRLKPWGRTKILAIACCVVTNSDHQVLLLCRHPEDLGGRKWGLPGGRLEEGETAEAAALRELDEETGLKPSQIHLLGTHQVDMPHGSVHITTYHVAVSTGTPIGLDPEEHGDYGWYDLSTLLTADNLLWGLPTILRDFGFVSDFTTDPTLADGSQATLLERSQSE